MRSFVLAIAGVLLLSGCGAKLTTTRITLPAKSDDCICGLVINHYEPHTAYAVFPDTPGSKTMQVQSARIMLPSLKEAYVVGYRGALFASRELTISLNGDGSLQGLKLTGDMQAAKALDAIAKQTETFAKAEKTIREEAEKAKKDPLDLENDELKKEIKNMMLKANKEALEQGLPLPYPNAN